MADDLLDDGLLGISISDSEGTSSPAPTTTTPTTTAANTNTTTAAVAARKARVAQDEDAFQQVRQTYTAKVENGEVSRSSAVGRSVGRRQI